MSKKADYTKEQIEAIHAEMVKNNWTMKETAMNNTVRKFNNYMTLYMAMYNIGLVGKKKIKEVVTV